MKRVEALALAALLSTSGCASAADPEAGSVEEAIREANAEFCHHLKTKNVTRLVNEFYAPGAILLPPGRAAIRGRDGIRNYWKSVLRDGEFEVEIATDLVETSCDLACEIGRYTLFSRQNGGTSEIADQGKYVVNWKRMDSGVWRAIADIFNSNVVAE